MDDAPRFAERPGSKSDPTRKPPACTEREIALAIGDGIAVRVTGGITELSLQALNLGSRKTMLAAIGLCVNLHERHTGLVRQVTLPQTVSAHHLQSPPFAFDRQTQVQAILVG